MSALAPMLRYLAACVLAGALVGRAFGAFARARFHYPAQPADVSAAHRALLDALDVVEWPGLFALTLVASLLLWRWLRPKSLPPAPGGSASARAATFAVCVAVALVLTIPPTRPEGRPLAASAGAAFAALGTALVGRLRAEARAASGPFLRRLAAQLPVATGHLAATTAASASLGFRGESALVHAFALVIGAAVFVAELAWCVATAALAGMRRGGVAREAAG